MNGGPPRDTTARSPLTPPLGRRASRPTDPTHHPTSITPLWRRQLPWLCAVAGFLLLALAASQFLRGVLAPFFWSAPFYINPFITLTLLIYVGIGLIMLSGPGDGGWPFYVGLIGIWVFVVTFEYSIVQWFTIQQGALFSGPRVGILIFIFSAAALGAAILLHMNQLARRLYNDLKDRGLEPQELKVLEHEAGNTARAHVLRLWALASAATLLLWLFDKIIGRTRLGLDVLGILAGLMILSLLLAYSYHVLKSGPVLESGPGPSRAPQSGHAAAPARPLARPDDQRGTEDRAASITDRRLE